MSAQHVDNNHSAWCYMLGWEWEEELGCQVYRPKLFGMVSPTQWTAAENTKMVKFGMLFIIQ